MLRTIVAEVRDKPHQIVDQDRRRPKESDEPGTLIGARLAVRRTQGVACGGSCTARQLDRAAEDRLDRRNDVGGLSHWHRALLEQRVGAFAARIERGTRNGKHLAALFAREPRRDQRTRATRGFHHNDANVTAPK